MSKNYMCFLSSSKIIHAFPEHLIYTLSDSLHTLTVYQVPFPALYSFSYLIHTLYLPSTFGNKLNFYHSRALNCLICLFYQYSGPPDCYLDWFAPLPSCFSQSGLTFTFTITRLSHIFIFYLPHLVQLEMSLCEFQSTDVSNLSRIYDG